MNPVRPLEPAGASTGSAMFPIRDTIRSQSYPYLTYSLIGINVLIFLFEASLGQAGFERLVQSFGLIPARFGATMAFSWVTVFTSMFLHGSWFHVLSNMWMLFIFGDNVEDRMGHLRFLGFYLLAGAGAGLAHVVFSLGSRLPTVGASGAIAGVLGAYFVLFPRSRVLTLVPLFILPWFVEIPAMLYLAIWFLTQLSSGLLAIGSLGLTGGFGGIAWWAHIGGFVVGSLTVWLFLRRRRTVPYSGPYTQH